MIDARFGGVSSQLLLDTSVSGTVPAGIIQYGKVTLGLLSTVMQ